MSRLRHISVRLRHGEYARLDEFRRTHGFNSVSEIVRAALSLVLADRAHTHNTGEPDDSEEIARMFEELANTYRQPDGTVPVRHKRKSL